MVKICESVKNEVLRTSEDLVGSGSSEVHLASIRFYGTCGPQISQDVAQNQKYGPLPHDPTASPEHAPRGSPLRR